MRKFPLCHLLQIRESEEELIISSSGVFREQLVVTHGVDALQVPTDLSACRACG